ncbi:hypothetical protein ACWEGE_34650 [Amycolatopsis sp. NPDC004747]
MLQAQRSRDNETLVEAARPGTFDDLTKVLASLAEREGHAPEEALTSATVTIAAMRGLLLQEVLAPPAHSEDAVALLLRMSR